MAAAWWGVVFYSVFSQDSWSDAGSKFDWLLLLTATLLATFVSLPLVIAAFLAFDEDKGVRKYLRRLYAILMLLCVTKLSIPLLTPYTFPYSWTSIILLWPEIRGFFNRGQDWRRMVVICGLVIGVFGRAIWWHWLRNPLPSDENLIKQFNTHRSELELLVKNYRNNRHGDPPIPSSDPVILELMKKAGVEKTDQASSLDFGEWYPEPYSDHTLQVLKSLEKRTSSNNEASRREKMEILHHELPELFEKTAPIEDVADIKYITSVIKINLGPKPTHRPTYNESYTSSSRYPKTRLTKGFCYFPQPPKVESGRIINIGYSLEDKAFTRPGLRVFDSLDDYPPNWERSECVLKRIDAHWFIFMCRTL